MKHALCGTPLIIAAKKKNTKIVQDLLRYLMNRLKCENDHEKSQQLEIFICDQLQANTYCSNIQCMALYYTLIF